MTGLREHPGTTDEVTVQVEMRPQDLFDKMIQTQALRDRIDREIQSISGLRMEIKLVKPQTLDRSMGKAVRVIDRRREKKQV